MGLAERRALKEFQENTFPQLKQQIDKAAKFGVTLEVNWDSLTLEDQANLYDESWKDVYFIPLVKALESICRDDLGQEALKANLKKIVIQNNGGISYGDRWACFDQGVLFLDHLPTTNVGDIEDRTKGLINVLEKGL